MSILPHPKHVGTWDGPAGEPVVGSPLSQFGRQKVGIRLLAELVEVDGGGGSEGDEVDGG